MKLQSYKQNLYQMYKDVKLSRQKTGVFTNDEYLQLMITKLPDILPMSVKHQIKEMLGDVIKRLPVQLLSEHAFFNKVQEIVEQKDFQHTVVKITENLIDHLLNNDDALEAVLESKYKTEKNIGSKQEFNFSF